MDTRLLPKARNNEEPKSYGSQCRRMFEEILSQLVIIVQGLNQVKPHGKNKVLSRSIEKLRPGHGLGKCQARFPIGTPLYTCECGEVPENIKHIVKEESRDFQSDAKLIYGYIKYSKHQVKRLIGRHKGLLRSYQRQSAIMCVRFITIFVLSKAKWQKFITTIIIRVVTYKRSIYQQNVWSSFLLHKIIQQSMEQS